MHSTDNCPVLMWWVTFEKLLKIKLIIGNIFYRIILCISSISLQIGWCITSVHWHNYCIDRHHCRPSRKGWAGGLRHCICLYLVLLLCRNFTENLWKRVSIRRTYYLLLSFVDDPWCPGGGEYSHVKANGDVPPKWVTFSPKILRHGSQSGQKILRRGSHWPFHKKIAKNL